MLPLCRSQPTPDQTCVHGALRVLFVHPTRREPMRTSGKLAKPAATSSNASAELASPPASCQL